jgi:hypothetical protein
MAARPEASRQPGRCLKGSLQGRPPRVAALKREARKERKRWDFSESSCEVATAFANKLHDKLEVVPTDKVLYAFIGHPPEQFGVAWFENGEEHNFKTLMKARNLQTRDINRISEELRAA